MKTGLQIVTETLKKEKVRKSELGRRIGLSRQAMNTLWHQRDITAVRFMEMMACLGYMISPQKMPFRKISTEDLEVVRSTKNPEGLFFCEDNGIYIAVDNRVVYSEVEFNNEIDCIKYLEKLS